MKKLLTFTKRILYSKPIRKHTTFKKVAFPLFSEIIPIPYVNKSRPSFDAYAYTQNVTVTIRNRSLTGVDSVRYERAGLFYAIGHDAGFEFIGKLLATYLTK